MQTETIVRASADVVQITTLNTNVTLADAADFAGNLSFLNNATLTDGGQQLTLGEMRRDPHNLEGFVDGMPLSIARDGKQIMLPTDEQTVREGDEILFCGTEHGELMLSASMNNVYTLDYLITGIDRPRGYFFQWLEAKT